MPTSDSEHITMEQFKQLVQQSGLELTDSELDELKPLYELHLPHINLLRSIDLGAEEFSVAFQPDFPSH